MSKEKVVKRGKPSTKSTEELEKQRKEREQKLKEIASQDIEELETESNTEREYNKKFSKMYVFVRKAFVVLRAKKITKSLNGEDLYNSALEVLERATNL